MIGQDKELTTNRDIGYLSCFLIAHQTTDSMHTPRRIGKHTSTKGGNERQGNQCKQMNMSKCNKSTNAKLYKLNYFAVLHQFSSYYKHVLRQFPCWLDTDGVQGSSDIDDNASVAHLRHFRRGESHSRQNLWISFLISPQWRRWMTKPAPNPLGHTSPLMPLL